MKVRRVLASVALTLALATQASCQGMISWSMGRTHGFIVETNALPPSFRLNLGIWKKPSQGIHWVYDNYGIRAAQDTLWNYGKPPSAGFSACHWGHCVSFTTAWLTNHLDRFVYDRTSDLRGAIVDSHARQNCLALTLFSNGNLTPNWTTKSSGCQTGSIPNAATATTGANEQSDESTVEGPYETWQPLTPEELARVEPDDLAYAGQPEPETPEVDVVAQADYEATRGGTGSN